jgi:hypothetical protein
MAVLEFPGWSPTSFAQKFRQVARSFTFPCHRILLARYTNATPAHSLRVRILKLGCPSIRTKALSRRKSPEQCFLHRVVAREKVEDQSSGSLTVNPFSANRSATHRYGLNSDHDSSIRIPIRIGTRAPNQSFGLSAVADARGTRELLST